jgi:type IX secretion system PorP/SprF family membrane protein
MEYRNIYIFLAIFFSTLVRGQQDDQLSEYPFNPIAVNPAYTGSKGGFSGIISARQQWVGLSGSPQTAALSIHSAIKNNKMGVGFRLRDEKNMFDQKTEASACYAYRLKFLSGKLGFGLSAGITSVNYNWFNVEFKDKNDKYNGLQKTQQLLPRIDAGLLFNDAKSYLSLSVTHLYSGGSSKNDATNYNGNIKSHIYFIYSRAFLINNSLALNPAVNIKYVQASQPSVDLNMYANIKESFWLGAGYRTNGTVIFLAQIIFDKKYKIGYSYDYFLNQKTLGQYTTHEIILSCDLKLSATNSLSFRYF